MLVPVLRAGRGLAQPTRKGKSSREVVRWRRLCCRGFQRLVESSRRPGPSGKKNALPLVALFPAGFGLWVQFWALCTWISSPITTHYCSLQMGSILFLLLFQNNNSCLSKENANICIYIYIITCSIENGEIQICQSSEIFSSGQLNS